MMETPGEALRVNELFEKTLEVLSNQLNGNKYTFPYYASTVICEDCCDHRTSSINYLSFYLIKIDDTEWVIAAGDKDHSYLAADIKCQIIAFKLNDREECDKQNQELEELPESVKSYLSLFAGGGEKVSAITVRDSREAFIKAIEERINYRIYGFRNSLIVGLASGSFSLSRDSCYRKKLSPLLTKEVLEKITVTLPKANDKMMTLGGNPIYDQTTTYTTNAPGVLSEIIIKLLATC